MVRWRGDELVAEEDDPEYRSASVDIFVDPAFQRRGYATAAILTLLDHLFDERGAPGPMAS